MAAAPPHRAFPSLHRPVPFHQATAAYVATSPHRRRHSYKPLPRCQHLPTVGTTPIATTFSSALPTTTFSHRHKPPPITRRRQSKLPTIGPSTAICLLDCRPTELSPPHCLHIPTAAAFPIPLPPSPPPPPPQCHLPCASPPASNSIPLAEPRSTSNSSAAPIAVAGHPPPTAPITTLRQRPPTAPTHSAAVPPP